MKPTQFNFDYEDWPQSVKLGTLNPEQCWACGKCLSPTETTFSHPVCSQMSMFFKMYYSFFSIEKKIKSISYIHFGEGCILVREHCKRRKDLGVSMQTLFDARSHNIHSPSTLFEISAQSNAI